MPANPGKNSQKTSFVMKLLIVGCAVNFVLLLVTIVTLSFFLARTGTKPEVGLQGSIGEKIEKGEGLIIIIKSACTPIPFSVYSRYLCGTSIVLV